MTKSELRKDFLVRQKAMTSAERHGASWSIASRFFEEFPLTSIRTLHCFLPIEKFGEIDTTPIIHAVWKNHPKVRVVVPRVLFTSGEMESVFYTAESDLAQNRWQISEPVEGATIAPSELDLVLVPGACFDRSGHRVGYGKGFYDRFLRECRPDCVKIGLSYFEPVGQIDGVHDGDIALDFVVTPELVFEMRNAERGTRSS